MRDKETVVAIERVLKALANRRRISIVRFLKGNKGETVGDIAEYIKLSFTSTSKHLKILSSAGVLESDQKSTFVHYRLAQPLPKFLHVIISAF